MYFLLTGNPSKTLLRLGDVNDTGESVQIFLIVEKYLQTFLTNVSAHESWVQMSLNHERNIIEFFGKLFFYI